MIYYKDKNEEIYAYEESDLEHDNEIRAQIAELESSDGNEDLITDLLTKIRISSELTQITEAEKDELLKPNEAQLAIQHAKSEHAWVKSELDAISVELMYHWTGDQDRAEHTEQAWKQYAIALRNYTSTDEDGNPIIVGESRPSIEDFIEAV